ncbi:MAG: hypothetical protein JWP67_3397 [Mucilaginibacter sp.]|nr:hypothetical protein [Mucilaginibacter sp.]
MPHNNHQDNKPESSKKPTPASQISAIEVKPQNGSEEQVRSKQPEQREKKPEKPRIINIGKIPKIDVIEGVDANRIARKSNNISLAAVIVNTFILVVTAWLALTAVGQYKSASSAAQIADKTYKADSLNKRVTRRTNDSLDNIKNKHDSLVFEYQKKSLGAQIASTQEAQKEFDIENRPLVQILNFAMDSINNGRHLKIKYDFINYGKQPVKGLTNRVRVDFLAKNKSPNYTKEGLMTSSVLNSYLSGMATSQNSWTSKAAINKVDSTVIKNGDLITWVNGKFSFQNTVTHKKSEYHYTYKLRYNAGTFDVEGVRDTTIDVASNKVGIRKK